jgi:hypothetical protein
VPPKYLIVRGRDLVVLGVRWEGCEVRAGATAPTLVATGSLPTVTVTFPPQALLEQTTGGDLNTAGLVHSDSRLTGVSELVFRVERGTVIELTSAGILDALVHLEPSSVVEMPWGLRLRPEPLADAGMVSEHAVQPLPGAGPDVVGLWQARLRAADGSRADARLVVRPQVVSAESDITPGLLFQKPPLAGWRTTIATAGAASPVRVTRLELSALGGSLSAAATWPDRSWSHEIALGRDQKVQVSAQGRLWPFGHRVVYQEYIRRAFLPVQASGRVGSVAGLLARRVLVIVQPLCTELRTPTFPFDEVEILGREFLTNTSAAPANPLLFMPSSGGTPLRFPVRCRSEDVDVRFAIPMVFVADANTQPLNDVVAAWRAHATVDIPGIELDMVGAGGLPGDVHQVHSLTFDAVPEGPGFRPDLKKFGVVLPALRSLLPDGGHDAVRSVTYAPELRHGEQSVPTATHAAELRTGERSVPAVPLRIDDGVPVNFTSNTDRSGGLVAPMFCADGIARELGPVATEVLNPPDLGAALENAFRGATLFGFPLASLIDITAVPQPTPPMIIQRRVGASTSVELRWENVKLAPHGPFQPKPGTSSPQLNLCVVSNPELLDTPEPPPTCSLSNFQLALPPTQPLITLAFDEVAFIQRPGEPMRLEPKGLSIEFGGKLKLLQELQKKVMQLLSGNGPTIRASATEIVVGYQLRIPDAPAGMFVMRNIAVRTEVCVPFAKDPVSVVVGFASREQPFSLTVSGFGGGGYAAVEIAGGIPSKLELSLEFGAAVAVDFVIAKAEVHALGGVRFVRDADGTMDLEAFIRIGGSVQLLGLVTVSIELRVALTFTDPPPRLTGRASLVIELDLTLYSDRVTVDSGEFVLVGGSAPSAAIAADITDDAARQEAWDRYWRAFA